MSLRALASQHTHNNNLIGVDVRAVGGTRTLFTSHFLREITRTIHWETHDINGVWREKDRGRTRRPGSRRSRAARSGGIRSVWRYLELEEDTGTSLVRHRKAGVRFNVDV